MMRKGRFLSDFHDVVKAEQQRIIQTVHYVCTNPLHPHSPPLTLTAPPAFLPMQTPPCAFLCGQQAVSHHDNRFSCPSQYICKHDQHCQYAHWSTSLAAKACVQKDFSAALCDAYHSKLTLLMSIWAPSCKTKRISQIYLFKKWPNVEKLADLSVFSL